MKRSQQASLWCERLTAFVLAHPEIVTIHVPATPSLACWMGTELHDRRLIALEPS